MASTSKNDRLFDKTNVALFRRNPLIPATFCVALIFALVLTVKAGANRTSTATPRVTVWAWERDEDLSYIDPSKVDVAYFAGNIYIKGEYVSFKPRTQKLKIPKGVKTMPVFRIYTVRQPIFLNGEKHSDSSAPNLSAADYVCKRICDQIRKLNQEDCVQLDFDALEDERPFYKTLLKSLRKQLPQKTKISITSLASWLLEDKWMEVGCADEVVAMLFSIGADKKDVLHRLKRQSLNDGAGIPIAIGISANEQSTNKSIFENEIQTKTKHLYIFSSNPWTKSRFSAITKEALAR